MTAPSVPIPAARTLGGRAKAGTDRFGGLVEAWLRGHTALVYFFLYVPIVIVVVFSFNATERRVTDWDGFSLRWYEYVLKDRAVQRYLGNSLIVGFSTAVLATIVGTMAALGLQRAPKWFRLPFDGLTYISVIVPELVIALATLVFFASTIGRDGILTNATGVELGFGFHTMVGALSLFNISLVLLLVRARLSGMDRTLVEASYDLYGTPWRTFWQITFPQLLPAIVAGFLLAFTFAFDDYLISTFVNGQGTSTLPLYVFGQIRVGVTPSTNAIAAVMLLITLSILLVGQLLLSRSARRSGGRGQVGGVAGIVAENAGGA
ncbi:MAG TPA: ABC transporter permease [Candidatus Limnocylindrales bacterium]|nr:ABC transporter permease [Candidatus Limnocylindrales bacterium]